MSPDQVQSVPAALATGQEAGSSTMSSSNPNRQAGGLGLQRTASKDLGSTLPGGVLHGAFGNAPQGGGLGLQRTMSRDMGGAGAQPGGLQRTMSRDLGGAGAEPGGLQRTMSRDLGGAGAQPGGLQRTMSRDLGGAGPQPGGLQRTMSRDLGTSQPGGGGLQRTMSSGLGNAQSNGVQRSVARDPLRQPRKASGKGERVPRPAGSQDVLPRPNVASS
ncbi:unnamed protein product [Calypogeia fissa]